MSHRWTVNQHVHHDICVEKFLGGYNMVHLEPYCREIQHNLDSNLGMEIKPLSL